MSETQPDRTDRPAGVGEIPVALFIRGIFFLLLVSGVVVSAHWYIGLRLIRDAQWPAAVQPVLWGVLWAGFGSIFAGFLGGRLLPRKVAGIAQWVGFIWMGMFGLLLTSSGASDLAFFIAGKLSEKGPEWGRAQALMVAALALPALVWGFYVARRTPIVERVTVPIKGLGKAFEGLRIVQITDIHIGETLDHRFLRRVVDQVNALNPDIVAVTGDAIDGPVTKLRDETLGFGGLKAKRGVFYVTGNHEYYHGAAAWIAEMKRLGLRPLINEHVVLEEGGDQLAVGGVPDLEGARFSESHRPQVDAAFAGAPPAEKAPRILLAHQPLFAKRAGGQGVQLMLSGHTHGGQIFPFMFLVRLQQPVIAGLRELWGVPVYTSRGTGYWGPPFRVGPSSEITEITLKAA
ncbi:MAG: metallophosphoesterase [Myxococcaceae bacterium]|nr:metallophosphoesterase [Myxococcaceae bacterium]